MPVLCEMRCVDIPDTSGDAMQIIEIATPVYGDTREIELRGTRVVYQAISDRSVRILHIILGEVGVIVNDPEELDIENVGQIKPVIGQIWNSDPDIGMSAIMLADGHITYNMNPPQPGITVMVRSQYLAPQEGEIIFG